MANYRLVYCGYLLCVLTAAVFTIPAPQLSAASTSNALTFESERNYVMDTNTDYDLSDDEQETHWNGLREIEGPAFYDFGDTERGGGQHRKNDEAPFQCESYPIDRPSPFAGSPCEPSNNRGHDWQPCKFADSNNTITGCYCHGPFATCCANLTYIPSFPETIRYLNFTGNKLTVLDQVTLENVTQLQWLLIWWNSIFTVTKDAFHKMSNLTCLEIIQNYTSGILDPQNFTYAVNSLTQLKSLTLNWTEFMTTTSKRNGLEYVMRNLNISTLEHLFMGEGQRLETFYVSDLAKLQNRLKVFSLRGHAVSAVVACSEESFNISTDDTRNYVSYDTALEPEDAGRGYGQITTNYCRNFELPNLRLLDLRYNWIVQFPVFCHPKHGNASDRHSVLPGLTHILLSVNAIIDPTRQQMTCLPSLRSLILPGNPIRRIRQGIFQGFPNLTELDLRFTNVLRIEEEAFSHDTLKSLTIKSSNWFFDTRQPDVYQIDPDLFAGSKLEYVDLSYNVFRYVKKERLNQILMHLRGVSKLLMSEIGLFSIPEVVTKNFTKLRSLGLRSNVIFSLPHGAFDNLPLLNHLDLYDNHLTNPSVEALQPLIKSQAVYLNLANNPFSCTCDLLKFLQLFKPPTGHNGRPPNATVRSGLHFVGHPYVCASPASVVNMHLESLHMTEHNCLLSLQQEVTITTVCLLIISTIFVYALLYRFRWQVRFWLYSIHVRWNTRQEGQGRGHRARFNAFVSYCSKDSNFVLSEILPALERGRRMPLCIHERDFVAGKYFDQNILEMMAESRHVLLVLSNAFLQDDWCRFELFVAQRYGLIHRKIPVTVLLLEQLHVQLMDAHVIMMLQSRPGLEWPGNECSTLAKEMFWGRLGQSLTRDSR